MTAMIWLQGLHSAMLHAGLHALQHITHALVRRDFPVCCTGVVAFRPKASFDNYTNNPLAHSKYYMTHMPALVRTGDAKTC